MNILLVAGIYPTDGPNYQGTPVCHYFAKEWKKLGHNVFVVHANVVLPKMFRLFGRIMPQLSKRKMLSFAFLPSSYKEKIYIIDNIPVYYLPILRPIPRRGIPKKNLDRATSSIYNYLKQTNYIPDVVVGHWTVGIVARLKAYYPNVRNAVVFHEPYRGSGQSFDRIDSIGFRSISLKNDFDSIYGAHKNEFICYSGVPADYIIHNEKLFQIPINRFVFVGKLLDLKRVQDTIQALNNVFGENDFTFDIVGDGPEKKSLEELTTRLSLDGKVVFHGFLPRKEAQQVIEESQCMVMVSDHEAFGLVYLEAMAKGCICIATKGQGGDGLVEENVNGYLCEAQNVDQLCGILTKISKLSKEQYKQMSSNAVKTAKKLTDENVAKLYLDSVLNEKNDVN